MRWLILTILLLSSVTNAGTVLFSEDFEGDTIGVPPALGVRGLQENQACTNHNWTVNGTAPISGTKDLLHSGTGGSFAVLMYQQLVSPADFEFSADVIGNDVYILFRAQGVTNLITYYFRAIAASNLIVLGGAMTSSNGCPVAGGPRPVVNVPLLHTQAPTINTSGLKNMKVRIEGSTITAFIDNVQQFQIVDASITTGGFFGVGGFSGGVHFDNILLVDLVGPTPTGANVPTGTLLQIPNSELVEVQ